MFKLLAFLVTGCWHKWEPISRNRLTGDGGAVGQRVTSRCTKCSKFKKQDLI